MGRHEPTLHLAVVVTIILLWLNFHSIEAIDEIAEYLYALRSNTALQKELISVVKNRAGSDLAALSIEVL